MMENYLLLFNDEKLLVTKYGKCRVSIDGKLLVSNAKIACVVSNDGKYF